MVDDKMTLSTPDDHNPRYNVSQDQLLEADKKMLSIPQAVDEVLKNSLDRKKQGGGEVVLAQDGESIIHKRTINEATAIWQEFLISEEPEFKEYMGYGRQEIEVIGPHKFVDAMDWRSKNDISKWRTDALHVIPCAHCQDEFAIFEHYGLCSSCRKFYDLKKLEEVIKLTNGEMPDLVTQQVGLFVYDPQIRKQYLLKGKD